MIRIICAISLLIFALLLDNYIDEVRLSGIKSIALDGLPNLIFSTLVPLSYVIYRKFDDDSIKLALAYDLGIIAYELIQLTDNSVFFDFVDICTTVIGTLTILLIRLLVLIIRIPTHHSSLFEVQAIVKENT